MINIAILGYGTVGSGVVEVCQMNPDMITDRVGETLNVKKILDIREFPDDPLADRFTKNPEEIFNDPDISVVVETIGGATFAYEMTRQALEHGKHVVTSNKELVATHGPELMALAQDKGVAYMFEASVGGGIPIIRPLHKCLSANVVTRITGILNGTTNYILTKMEKDGIDFAGALAEAQALGYAEQDPTADVEGHDAARKIAILASITYGEFVDSETIYTEGISKITTADMDYAVRLGCKIKLVGVFQRREDGLADLIVAPMLLPADHPVAVADDVFNAIMVEGNALGEAMFYGRGAGKLPTASAVVADVIECAMHLGKVPHMIPWKRNGRKIVNDHDDAIVKALIRLPAHADDTQVERLFSSYDLQWLDAANENEKALLVGQSGQLTESQLQSALNQLGSVISWIRKF